MLLNGKPADSALWNRGLAFGDGVFETITFRHQRAPLWDWHMQRMRHACKTLQIEQPDQEILHRQCLQLLQQPSGVIRINLVRRHSRSSNPMLGAYSSAAGINAADSILVYRPLPEAAVNGLTTAWGSMRLSRQPLTAGIKHLNRLEQVMAAREADILGVDDLLLQDTDGNVIEAISSNLLVYDHSGWATPCLHHSGVAGVMRQWLLDHQLITERTMREPDISQAEALALCNSVRGLQPIFQHAGRTYADAGLAELQSAIQPLGL